MYNYCKYSILNPNPPHKRLNLFLSRLYMYVKINWSEMDPHKHDFNNFLFFLNFLDIHGLLNILDNVL